MKRWLGIVLVAILGCVACGQASRDHAHQLQSEIGAAIDTAMDVSAGTDEDIRRFVQDADATGVVHIPAGCWEITTAITIPDGTQVVGAGMDETILYRNPNKSRGMSLPIFRVRGQPGQGGTHISGIAFVGVRNTQDTGEDYGVTLANCTGYRVDHCYFEGFGSTAVEVRGQSRGVVDHCIFVDNFKQGIDNLGYGVAVYGANEWAADPPLGTVEANYVEDCMKVGSRHAIASSAGAHYVFRHNVVQANVVAHAVDAHGMGWGNARGTRAVEIYANVIENPVDKWAGVVIRGGDGVVFGNTIKGYRNPVLLVVEWGTPEALKSTYPAFDQIRDLWIWDNTDGRGTAEPVVDETAVGWVEEGRDYFTDPKPGYKPYIYPHPLAQGGPFD
jgi:hypothetical protein